MIDYSPLVGIVRIFDGGSQFGDKYKAVLSIAWHDKETAELLAAHGEITKQDMREIRDTLAGQGAKSILVKRKVPHKVPLGKFLYEANGFAVWRVEV